MKIILTGAQGTGKTTIKNLLELPGHEKIMEVCRALSKEGVKINEDGDTDSQWKIFNKYSELFYKTENFISDRGFSDVVAYSAYLAHHDKMEWPEYHEMHDIMIDNMFIDKDKYIIFYFPIEFNLVNDGVRSMDGKFREFIDREIRMNVADIEKELGIPVFEVRGSVEERMEYINKCIEEFQNK